MQLFRYSRSGTGEKKKNRIIVNALRKKEENQNIWWDYSVCMMSELEESQSTSRTYKF